MGCLAPRGNFGRSATKATKEDDEDIVDETTGHAFVPQNPEGLFYDHDGNVGADGRWAYSWDGENRLIGMEAWEDLPAGARKKLAFSYDWQGRRTGKVVWTWNTSTNGYEQVSSERFAYDGWNLIASLDKAQNSSTPPLQRSFMWGNDLSGSLDGAGGVGGLLCFTSHLGSLTSHFAAYDGNGNVTALVDTTGATTANYEYSPFGGLLRCEGEYAKANPFRFSSKFTDEETGLLYYGYRFYSPTLGRWLGKDPLGERGGLNLYGFCSNSPIILFDTDGRSAFSSTDAFYDDMFKTLGDRDYYDYVKGLGDEITRRKNLPSGQWDQRLLDAMEAEYMDAVKGGIRGTARMNGNLGPAGSALAAGEIGSETMGTVTKTLSNAGGKAARFLLDASKKVGPVLMMKALAEGSSGLAGAASDFTAYRKNGDNAMADLTVLCDVALYMLNGGGDYFVTMAVVDALLQ